MKIDFEMGWFSGEDASLLELNIMRTSYEAFNIFFIKIFKFCVSLSITKE